MNIMNLYVYENRNVSNDLSKPILLENLNVDNVQIHIPKEIDGTDMGTWAWWFVYQNAKREKYSIPMTLEGVTNDEGEEEYISTVSLNHGFTGKHGTVMYAIEAIQADGSGAVTHEWHTKTCKLEIVYTLQGNQTEYDESESDIISALISRVNELITSGAEIAEIAEMIESAAETAQEVIDSIPQDYSALSSDVDDLKADLGDLDERVEALESGGGGSGLTDDVKTALMNLVNHVAWDDDDPTGQTYIDALELALYPPADLVSISAVYTQSGTVYDTDTLESLKSDLVVTATLDNGTTQTVTAYSLSGLLEEGTSIITVMYGGKTATFNVTVTSLMTTASITWTGSGADKTSSFIDATNADVYWTLPYIEGFSGYSSAASSDSDFIRLQAYLYSSDAEGATSVGRYHIDNETIEVSSRTTVNRPSMPCNTQVKVAPNGYYVKLMASRVTGGGFKDNANCGTFLNTYANTVKLMATSGG